ncbi:MAG: SPOR domain-containing protein [Bacteroidia bacterium]|nr:SPOR domain-containing protein [Bacteroidia bacterium]
MRVSYNKIRYWYFVSFSFLLITIFSLTGASVSLGQTNGPVTIRVYPKGYSKNQEKYDDNQFKASHPSLPMGTKIIIYRPDKGNSVTVEINDRCKSLIMITAAAGKALGMKREEEIAALIYVKGEPNSPDIIPSERSINPGNPASVLMQKTGVKRESFGIKVAQSNDYEEIKAYIQFMQQLGYNNLLCHCYNKENQEVMYFRLIIGPFEHKQDALKIYNRLKNQNIAAKIIALDKLK